MQLTTIIRDTTTRRRTRSEAVHKAVSRHINLTRTRKLLDIQPGRVFLLEVKRIEVPTWRTHNAQGTTTTTSTTIPKRWDTQCMDQTCPGRPCRDGYPDPKYQCPWYRTSINHYPLRRTT